MFAGSTRVSNASASRVPVLIRTTTTHDSSGITSSTFALPGPSSVNAFQSEAAMPTAQSSTSSTTTVTDDSGVGAGSSRLARPTISRMATGTIDLTSSSPPSGRRSLLALPRASSATNANAQAGPSRPQPSRSNTGHSRTTEDAIVLSSDDDDEDDDIVVMSAAPGASRTRSSNARHMPVNIRPAMARRLRSGAATAATAGSHSAPTSRDMSPDLDADYIFARRLQDEEERRHAYGVPLGMHATFDGRRSPHRDRLPDGLMRVPPLQRHMHREDEGGTSIWERLGNFIRQGYENGFNGRVRPPTRQRDNAHDFMWLNDVLGMGAWEGGAGGAAGAPKPRPAKRYTVKTSHPRKLEPGFMRDIVSPEDQREKIALNNKKAATLNGLPNKKRKRAKVGPGAPASDVEVEPVCASCLTRLLLAQSDDGRLWALKCGHVVCGKCIGQAKERCVEISQRDKAAARWKESAAARAKRILVVDDSDDEDDLDFVATDDDSDEARRTNRKRAKLALDVSKTDTASASTSSSGKGKSRSRADETGIEEDWTACPVTDCSGEGTNLLAPAGSNAGAFPIYV
ncbi:hypothetical protein OIO90_003662 [Microbotryomycetes sp. JL221]|nr:hypothetical protein OIO90_003662 [Microbotryomycetes sp. JL221]